MSSSRNTPPLTTGNGTKDAVGPLLHWLMQQHPNTPKTRAKQWIVAGRVSVNGVVVRKPHEMIADPGCTLALLDRHATSLACSWQIHRRVALLHLDGALAIVNKGPGLIAVPAPDGELSALSILADFLAGRLKPWEPGGAGKSLPPAYRRLQPLPVHRLDKHTSGVFCMATHPTARLHLIAQLKAHTMQREYVAFVDGRSTTRAGTWRHWVQLSPDEMRQQIVSEPSAGDGSGEVKEAITHYVVIAEYPRADGRGMVTQLRLRLETGRKHQIRLQAAHAGLPLLGDRTYHPGYRRSGRTGALIDFPRQALHAEVLALDHPEQPGTRMRWTAELPEDLRHLEAALRAGRL